MQQGKRRSKKRDKSRLLECLNDCNGIVAYACKKADISRVTYYKYYKEDPLFKQKADDIQELQIDVAEAALLKKIKNEDTTAIIFYLKTKGKTRGYSERYEIGGPGGGPLQVEGFNVDALSLDERKILLKIAEHVNANR